MQNFFGKKFTNKAGTILAILVFVALVGFMFKYNNDKNIYNNMQSLQSSEIGENGESTTTMQENSESSVGSVVGMMPESVAPYQKVSGVTGPSSKSASCNNQPLMDPKQLLPLDTNKEWSMIEPNKDLKNINLVDAGKHYGINTVAGSLRNPNLQIRSEPIIEKKNIGPWNQTTIDADTDRKSLEIGSTGYQV